MHALRPDTRALIDRLESEPDPGLIDAIGATGDPAAVVHLLAFVADDAPIARVAASAVASLLRPLPMKFYPQLEAERRVGGEWGRRIVWYSLKPKDLARLSQLPDAWAALGLASFHHDGYVREAAVRALSWRDSPAGLEMPFLVLRLNDWVSQVRNAARAAMDARVSAHGADGLLRALPLILSLGGQRRDDHTPFVDAVLALLQSPEARPALLRGIRSDDRLVRRESFRMLLTAKSPPEDLLRLALSDSDIMVRANATAELPRLPPGAGRRVLLDLALGDSASLVRRRALPCLASEPVEHRVAVFEDFLSDLQASARQLARDELVRLRPGFDAAARYREFLGSSPGARLRGVILGLGETGAEEDVLLLPPLLTDRRVKIRAAAIRATAQLDKDSVSPFLDALEDESKRVSRAAARILETRPRRGLLDGLYAIAEKSGIPEHARVHALDVLQTAPPWTRLLYLMRAIGSRNQNLARLALQRIDAHTGIPPTAEEVAAVEAALATAALSPALAESIHKELLFWRST